MRTTTKLLVLLAAVLAVCSAKSFAIEFEAGRPLNIPQIGAIRTTPGIPDLKTDLPGALNSGLLPGTVLPGAIDAALPGAIDAGINGPQLIAPESARLNANAPEMGLPQLAGGAASFSVPGGPGWTPGSRLYDGAKEFAPVDGNGYYDPSGNESAKIAAARGWAAQKSQAFQALNSEFDRKGGYFLMGQNLRGGAMSSSGWDRQGRPVVVLSNDLLNRYNGRFEDEYRGAPWEFIASVIAREQMFSSDWYASIPASAEKLAVSFMNMVKVFVDLTNGSTRSWATDKDFPKNANDRKSVEAWGWYQQLVYAARAAAANVGQNAGHLIDSKFLSWARDWVARQETSHPAFQHTLWELYDGKYYRPNDATINGQAIPSAAGRIDKATYDRESYKVYGADGKGSNKANQLDQQTVFGWIISWLKGRSEI